MKLWIARTKGGKLRMFFNKPHKTDDGKWFYLDNHAFADTGILIDKNNFLEVTFDNSPQEVELKLKNEIVGVAESPLKTFPRVNVFETESSYRH